MSDRLDRPSEESTPDTSENLKDVMGCSRTPTLGMRLLLGPVLALRALGAGEGMRDVVTAPGDAGACRLLTGMRGLEEGAAAGAGMVLVTGSGCEGSTVETVSAG